MEQIAHTIQGTFSPEANTRMAAELALTKLFGQPGQDALCRPRSRQ